MGCQVTKLEYLERRARGESVRPPRGERILARNSTVAILKMLEVLRTAPPNGPLAGALERYEAMPLAKQEGIAWDLLEPSARRIRGKR